MVPGSLCVSGYIHLSAIDITPPAKYKLHSAGCPSTLSSVSKVYRKVSRVAPPRRAAAHEGPKLDRHFRSTGDQYSAQVRPRGPRRTELTQQTLRGADVSIASPRFFSQPVRPLRTANPYPTPRKASPCRTQPSPPPRTRPRPRPTWSRPSWAPRNSSSSPPSLPSHIPTLRQTKNHPN